MYLYYHIDPWFDCRESSSKYFHFKGTYIIEKLPDLVTIFMCTNVLDIIFRMFVSWICLFVIYIMTYIVTCPSVEYVIKKNSKKQQA